MLKIVKNLWAVRAPPRTPLGSSQRSPRPVMWSETVGHRTRPVCDQKKIGLGLGLARSGLGLAGFVLCCEVQSCHARRQNDLGGHSSFSNTSLVSILCFEHHYCGDQQWRSLT